VVAAATVATPQIAEAPPEGRSHPATAASTAARNGSVTQDRCAMHLR
jgi:hypothetical protein